MVVEFLDHTADIAARITAGDPPEFFREAMRALNLILLGEESSGKIRPQEEVRLKLKAPDAETLLVDYLNEIIYHFDSRKWIFSSVEFEEIATGKGNAVLHAVLHGERFDPARHILQTEIKAATFHELEVRISGDRITADVVFDL